MLVLFLILRQFRKMRVWLIIAHFLELVTRNSSDDFFVLIWQSSNFLEPRKSEFPEESDFKKPVLESVNHELSFETHFGAKFKN